MPSIPAIDIEVRFNTSGNRENKEKETINKKRAKEKFLRNPKQYFSYFERFLHRGIVGPWKFRLQIDFQRERKQNGEFESG